MTTYESKTTVNQPRAKVFEQMSDLRNLEKYKANFPENDLDLQFEQNFVSVKIPNFGQGTVNLVGKEEPSKLTFSVGNLPISAIFSIKLDEIQTEKTEIKLILEAEIPFFIRPMIEKKLSTGLDKVAEILTFALNK